MDRRTVMLALFAGLSTPSSALACFDSFNSGALIHNSLPEHLPRDVVVFEGSLPLDYEPLFREGLRVPIRRVVRGDLRGRYALLRETLPISSCAQPLSNGRHGMIVGKVIGAERGVAIIRPVFAWKANRYRLRDGFQFPPDFDQLTSPWVRRPAG